MLSFPINYENKMSWESVCDISQRFRLNGFLEIEENIILLNTVQLSNAFIKS